MKHKVSSITYIINNTYASLKAVSDKIDNNRTSFCVETQIKTLKQIKI